MKQREERVALAQQDSHKKIKVWLDDVRKPPTPFGWDWFKSEKPLRLFYLVHEDQIEEMSLDHDLWNGSTGYDFLVWLEEKIFTREFTRLPKISIHSMNPVGKYRMEECIDRMKRFLDFVGEESLGLTEEDLDEVYYPENDC